jgi:hypothetical protein
LSRITAPALGLLLVLGLVGAPEPSVPVTVDVRVDGVPADVLLVITQGEDLIAVEYTDVHTPGRAGFSLAPGGYTLSVEHGAGFTSEPEIIELSVEPDAPAALTVEIARRFDPRAEGYYSADLHTHTAASAAAMERDFGITNHGVTPVDQAVGVQRAADLDVMFISDHNSVDGHELFAQTAEERGVPYILSEEITTLQWGHFNPYMLDPGALIPYSPEKIPDEYFAEARAAGAAVIQINHPLEPGLGYFFSRTAPEFNPSFDVVEAMNGPFDDGDFYAIEQLFRYWNEGKRYTAVGVSDDHDWKALEVRYGSARTYVHLSGELTAVTFLESLMAGHAFATYGPLVYLTANGSAIPGDTLTLSSGDVVTLEARIQSVEPLDSLRAEVVRSGVRVAAFDLSGNEQTISFEDAPEGDGWYVVRLMDSQRAYLALTNPIWVEINP